MRPGRRDSAWRSARSNRGTVPMIELAVRDEHDRAVRKRVDPEGEALQRRGDRRLHGAEITTVAKPGTNNVSKLTILGVGPIGYRTSFSRR